MHVLFAEFQLKSVKQYYAWLVEVQSFLVTTLYANNFAALSLGMSYYPTEHNSSKTPLPPQITH